MGDGPDGGYLRDWRKSHSKSPGSRPSRTRNRTYSGSEFFFPSYSQSDTRDVGERKPHGSRHRRDLPRLWKQVVTHLDVLSLICVPFDEGSVALGRN